MKTVFENLAQKIETVALRSPAVSATADALNGAAAACRFVGGSYCGGRREAARLAADYFADAARLAAFGCYADGSK